jgi:hypothetical protein
MRRFNLFKCFTLAYLVITFGAIPISIGLSIMTKLSKIIWDDDGNVVLASAYGQYAAGLLGAGMSSPDEEASVTKLQDILKDIINGNICFNCGFTTNSSFSTN